jgi:hypothetical protein
MAIKLALIEMISTDPSLTPNQIYTLVKRIRAKEFSSSEENSFAALLPSLIREDTEVGSKSRIRSVEDQIVIFCNRYHIGTVTDERVLPLARCHPDMERQSTKNRLIYARDSVRESTWYRKIVDELGVGGTLNSSAITSIFGRSIKK